MLERKWVHLKLLDPCAHHGMTRVRKDIDGLQAGEVEDHSAGDGDAAALHARASAARSNRRVVRGAGANDLDYLSPGAEGENVNTYYQRSDANK